MTVDGYSNGPGAGVRGRSRALTRGEPSAGAPVGLAEWTAWALAVDVPSSRKVGPSTAKVILVAYVQHAGMDSTAYPSAATVADESRLSPRVVEEAFRLFREAGIFVKVGTKGRATRHRIMAGDWKAGEVAPLNCGAIEAEDLRTNHQPSARESVGEPRPDLRGDGRSDLRSDPRWSHRTNGKELKGIPPTPRGVSRRREDRETGRLADYLVRLGIPELDHEAVLARAQSDPETKDPVKRLEASADYARDCHSAVVGQRQRAAPKCPDHPGQLAKHCGPCRAERISEASSGRTSPSALVRGRAHAPEVADPIGPRVRAVLAAEGVPREHHEMVYRQAWASGAPDWEQTLRRGGEPVRELYLKATERSEPTSPSSALADVVELQNAEAGVA